MELGHVPGEKWPYTEGVQGRSGTSSGKPGCVRLGVIIGHGMECHSPDTPPRTSKLLSDGGL